ncbi:MAG: hypothetical protein R3F34_04100 [Planctomycetota bacterium]
MHRDTRALVLAAGGFLAVVGLFAYVAFRPVSEPRPKQPTEPAVEAARLEPDVGAPRDSQAPDEPELARVAFERSVVPDAPQARPVPAPRPHFDGPSWADVLRPVDADSKELLRDGDVVVVLAKGERVRARLDEAGDASKLVEGGLVRIACDAHVVRWIDAGEVARARAAGSTVGIPVVAAADVRVEVDRELDARNGDEVEVLLVPDSLVAELPETGRTIVDPVHARILQFVDRPRVPRATRRRRPHRRVAHRQRALLAAPPARRRRQRPVPRGRRLGPTLRRGRTVGVRRRGRARRHRDARDRVVATLRCASSPRPRRPTSASFRTTGTATAGSPRRSISAPGAPSSPCIPDRERASSGRCRSTSPSNASRSSACSAAVSHLRV